MALPDAQIKLENGNLGGVVSRNDGISALALTGVAVQGASKVLVETPYQVFSLKEAEELGISRTGLNSYAYRHVKEFYDAAGEGSELWIMLFLQEKTMAYMVDIAEENSVKKMIEKANGKINLLGVSRKHEEGETIANGVDEDVDNALTKSQATADDFADKFMPFRVLIDGKGWTGETADLKDYRTADFNRCGVILGATDATKNAAIGLFLGLLAAQPVQRKISRVKNGAVRILDAYFTDGSKTEIHRNSWNSIHDKGYIFFRDFTGKSGYFVNDDSAATAVTDDYNTISLGRVVDKAIRIAYITYVNEVGDEIEVDDDGKIPPAEIKDLQGIIENAILAEMVNESELSAVDAFIDENQNVLSTSKTKISLKIRPVGYKNYIEVSLGFDNPAIEVAES